MSINKAIDYAENKAKEVITDCNDYIRKANRAYEMSNRKRYTADRSLAIKEITLADLVFSEDNAKYCIVICGEK